CMVALAMDGTSAYTFSRLALPVARLWLLWRWRETRAAVRYASRMRLLGEAGFAFAGDLAFWHLSIRYTSVANSTLLANLASIFVTLAAWLFLRERPTGLFLAGLASALAGVGLLVSTSLSFSGTALLGDAMGVATAAFYAGYLSAVQELRARGETVLGLMATTSAITAALLLPV